MPGFTGATSAACDALVVATVSTSVIGPLAAVKTSVGGAKLQLT